MDAGGDRRGQADDVGRLAPGALAGEEGDAATQDNARHQPRPGGDVVQVIPVIHPQARTGLGRDSINKRVAVWQIPLLPPAINHGLQFFMRLTQGEAGQRQGRGEKMNFLVGQPAVQPGRHQAQDAGMPLAGLAGGCDQFADGRVLAHRRLPSLFGWLYRLR